MSVPGRVILTIATLAALAGCASPGAIPVAGGATSAPVTTNGSPPGDHAAIYAAVIKHYLLGPDTSFPTRFSLAYVLDVADSSMTDVAGSAGRREREPISPAAQAFIVRELSDVATVVFVSDRRDVIDVNDGCGQVKDGAILVAVAPPNGAAPRVTVAINGYVACLGATWLTYVVEQDAAGAWQVTGTTGSMAVA